MKGGVRDTRRRVDDSVLTLNREKLAAGKGKELPRATSCAARKDSEGYHALQVTARNACARVP